MPLNKLVNDLDGSTVLARAGKAVPSGTGTAHDSYTGELGEITYDTTDNRIVAHDGSTAGGHPMAKEGETGNGAEITYAAGLAAIVTLGVPLKLVAVTAQKGDAQGFTVGTDNTLTATYKGTKLCHVKGRFLVDNETGADALTLHVFVGGVSAFETASQAVTAASAKLFEIDVLLDVANGEAIEIYGENEDVAVDLDTIAAAERVDSTPAHGFLRVTAM